MLKETPPLEGAWVAPQDEILMVKPLLDGGEPLWASQWNSTISPTTAWALGVPKVKTGDTGTRVMGEGEKKGLLEMDFDTMTDL